MVTFIKGGPRGSSLCEKMLFISDARAPYMQIVESNASMATGSKCCQNVLIMAFKKKRKKTKKMNKENKRKIQIWF